MIRLFKLVNGETVIGECETNLDFDWIVKRPHTIMVIPQNNGSMGVALIDFIFGAKDEYTVVLRSKDIIGEPVEADIQMLRMWDSKMAEILKRTTGIEVVGGMSR